MTDSPSSFKSWSRKKRWTIKLLMVACGLLIGLFFAEIGLRIAGYSYPVFYMPDVERGYALRPRMEGWYRKENSVYVRISSDGLRDREHEKAKPAGTLRIAVIGDSYAEALQVPLENAFWYVLEQKLQSCPANAGRKVEVINFGVSGYGTAQELITLRRRVWEYSPDVVLLAMTTNNDVSDNVLALKRTDQIPYFVYREGQLVLDDSFLATRAFRLNNSLLGRTGAWIRDHSRVIQAISHGQVALKYFINARKERAAQQQQQQQAAVLSPPSVQAGQKEQPAAQTNNAGPAGASPAPAAASASPAAPAPELGADVQVYREPASPVWHEAWRVTEGLVRQMRDEVEGRGARFFVVTLSNGVQVLPDPGGRDAFMRSIGVKDLFYPDRRIRAFCEREGIQVITLAPALQSYADEHKVFLHGFGKEPGYGHWNELGHRVAGEMIARELCEAIPDEQQSDN